MGHAIDERPFPRGALIGGFLMIGISMAMAFVARQSDVGATRLELAQPVESIDLKFVDLKGGSIGVLDAKDGHTITELEPGQSGFVRVVMRGLAHDRVQQKLGDEAPFRLSRRADGIATLEDLATGQVVTLTAFGSGNAEAFAQLLRMGRSRQ